MKICIDKLRKDYENCMNYGICRAYKILIDYVENMKFVWILKVKFLGS